MQFRRTLPVPHYIDYSRYRQLTRADFRRYCAHCFRHEDDLGGEEFFVQDHFEPKSRVNVDPSDFLNLYWSCSACNARQNKGNKWPSETQLAAGEQFCDPCHHDPEVVDYDKVDDGTLQALTPAGVFTIRHIRLNERPSLVKFREGRQRQQKITEAISRLRDELSRMQDQLGSETVLGLPELLEKLEQLWR